MVEIDPKHAEALLAMVYSYRRVVAEMGSNLTNEQAEAIGELRDECASAEKAALRKERAA